MRIVAVVGDAAVELFVGLMNHFPLFALLLRIKDPRRLPGASCPLLSFLLNQQASHIHLIDAMIIGSVYFEIDERAPEVLVLKVWSLLSVDDS